MEIGLGFSINLAPLKGQWLDTWMDGKEKKRTTGGWMKWNDRQKRSQGRVEKYFPNCVDLGAVSDWLYDRDHP